VPCEEDATVHEVPGVAPVESQRHLCDRFWANYRVAPGTDAVVD
jgi:hypothetical protein